MAIFPFVIFRTKAESSNGVCLNHEKIHIRQQIELLVVAFFIWYAIEYLLRLLWYRDKSKAYRNISFEREAYGNENNNDYLSGRRWWKFTDYL